MRTLLLRGVLAPAAVAQTPPPPPDAYLDLMCPEEVQPELIGGLAGLQARVAYPDEALRQRVEGQVVVRFVVTETGAVEDAEILRSPSPLLDAPALAAVRASRFTPGEQRGRPVRVQFAVPVTFRLPGE